MLYYVGHGGIIPKPEVAELCGNHVRFKDGSEERVEVIIYATGYNIVFPFMDKKYLNWKNNRPHLYLNIFHPEYDNLFVAGLIQPDSGQWGLVDYQIKLIAKFIRGIILPFEILSYFSSWCEMSHETNSGSAYARSHELCFNPSYSVYFTFPPSFCNAAAIWRDSFTGMVGSASP